MRSTRHIAALLLGACLILPRSSSAHTQKTERSLVLQWEAEGAVALWTMRLEAEEAALLVATHDVDRDGLLNEEARKRIGALVLARAASGVRLTWNGAPITMREPQVKVRLPNVSDRGLVATALVTLELPEVLTDTGVVGVEVPDGKRPLHLELKPRDDWRITTKAAAPSGVAAGGARLVVAAGDALELRMVRHALP